MSALKLNFVKRRFKTLIYLLSLIYMLKYLKSCLPGNQIVQRFLVLKCVFCRLYAKIIPNFCKSETVTKRLFSFSCKWLPNSKANVTLKVKLEQNPVAMYNHSDSLIRTRTTESLLSDTKQQGTVFLCILP